MTQVRLLPIVIAAGVALLALKSLGIMTGGGYVLTGPSLAVAAGASPSRGSGAAALAVPPEPTLVDAAPTLDDEAPTLAVRTGGASDAATAADAASAGNAPVVPDIDRPAGFDANAAMACPPEEQSLLFTGGCGPRSDGEAAPMVIDAGGNAIPLAEEDRANGSEGAILERLAERREELDGREAELDMRLALVEAAEKRIEERTQALQALEARINAVVDEKRTLEEAQFTAVVAMYETMKPKEAAAIFDELDMDVLLRVARALNPRKMAPIMARMDAIKARDLTAGLAIDRLEPTIDLASDNLSALPQIVGQ